MFGWVVCSDFTDRDFKVSKDIPKKRKLKLKDTVSDHSVAFVLREIEEEPSLNTLDISGRSNSNLVAISRFLPFFLCSSLSEEYDMIVVSHARANDRDVRYLNKLENVTVFSPEEILEEARKSEVPEKRGDLERFAYAKAYNDALRTITSVVERSISKPPHTAGRPMIAMSSSIAAHEVRDPEKLLLDLVSPPEYENEMTGRDDRYAQWCMPLARQSKSSIGKDVETLERLVEAWRSAKGLLGDMFNEQFADTLLIGQPVDASDIVEMMYLSYAKEAFEQGVPVEDIFA